MQTLAALKDLLQLEGLLSRPAALLPQSGYGLPQADEREAIADEGSRQATQWQQRGERLRIEARRWLSPQRQAALEATEANIDFLGQRLRRLHREQGGLQLR